MATMTLSDAYDIGRPILFQPGKKNAEERAQVANWVEAGMPMTQAAIPNLVSQIRTKLESNLVTAANVTKLILDSVDYVPYGIANLSLDRYPAYLRLREFFAGKLHASDSSGHAWQGAIYGRKVRGKDEMHDGLADEIGEFQALASFFVLNHGLKGIRQLQIWAKIAWAEIKEWLVAAIRKINKYHGIFFRKMKNLLKSGLGARAFCLAIFLEKTDTVKKKKLSGKTQKPTQDIRHGDDEFETDEDDEEDGIDDDGAYSNLPDPDDHQSKKEKDLLADERRQARRIIAETLKKYQESGNPRLARIASMVQPNMLLNGFWQPKHPDDMRTLADRVTDLLTALWEWGNSHISRHVSANSLAKSPDEALKLMYAAVQMGYRRGEKSERTGETEISFVRRMNGTIIELYSKNMPTVDDFLEDKDVSPEWTKRKKKLTVMKNPNSMDMDAWICQYRREYAPPTFLREKNEGHDEEKPASWENLLQDGGKNQADKYATSYYLDTKGRELICRTLRTLPMDLDRALQGNRKQLETILARIDDLEEERKWEIQDAIQDLMTQQMAASAKTAPCNRQDAA